MDVFTYEEASLLIGAQFNAMDSLGFENREKISVIALSYGFPRPDIDGVIPYQNFRVMPKRP